METLTQVRDVIENGKAELLKQKSGTYRGRRSNCGPSFPEPMAMSIKRELDANPISSPEIPGRETAGAIVRRPGFGPHQTLFRAKRERKCRALQLYRRSFYPQRTEGLVWSTKRHAVLILVFFYELSDMKLIQGMHFFYVLQTD